MSFTTASSEQPLPPVAGEPETPAVLTLTAAGEQIKRRRRVYLDWSGATTNTVDIFRDGTRVAANEYNDGSFSDRLRRKGSGTYVYQVCESGSSVCSNNATVRF